MEAIYNNLVHLRNGIENIVSNWDAAQFLATKLDEIVTIYATKADETGPQELRAGSGMMSSDTVNYVDRILMTMMKLTDANKAALNRYGKLDELLLPDALFEAADFVFENDRTCYIQLMQRSAELLHLEANYWLGTAYKYGVMVKKDLNLALFHFRVASSLGSTLAMAELMNYYHNENDTENLFKYINTSRSMAPEWMDQILSDYHPVDRNFENVELEPHLIRTSQSMCAFHQSIDHFFGIWARKSNRRAVEALPTFDSGFYFLHVDADDPDCFYTVFKIHPHHYGWKYLEYTMRMYLDFLFESNQFLSFFILSYDMAIYSPRQWKRYVLHAANSNCVDAHILLAQYYSSVDHRNEHEMKRHLRIAADNGNSQAQSVYRQMFGKRSNLSKGLKLTHKSRDGNGWKNRHRIHTKQSEKKG